MQVAAFVLLSAVVVVAAESEFQSEILSKHNEKRRGEPAANLKELTWSTKLASYAQAWADECKYEHGQVDSVANPNSIGQSVFSEYAAVGDPPATHLGRFAVEAWFSEKKDYDFKDARCNGDECKHYTQIVSARTTEVGCGYKRCDGSTQELVICNYLPIQDVEGIQPYKLKN